MNCRKAQRIMYLYRLGELPPDTRAALEGHCRICAACAREAEGMEILREATAALRNMEPPAADGLVRNVMESVSTSTRGQYFRRIQLSRRWHFAIAAILTTLTLLPVGQNIIDAGRIAALESRLAHQQGEQQRRNATELALWAGLVQVASQNISADRAVQKELWSWSVRLSTGAFQEEAGKVRDEFFARHPMVRALLRGKEVSPADQRRAVNDIVSLLNELR